MEIFSNEFRTYVKAYARLRGLWAYNLEHPDNSPAFKRHCAATYLRDLEILMAEKKKSTPASQGSNEKADFKGFINVTLTGDHKAAIKAWDLETADLFDWVATTTMAGHKISFSYNKVNDTHTASVMCVSAKAANAGLVVNSYAKDLYSALKALCYKVDHVLPARWADYEDAESDMG